MKLHLLKSEGQPAIVVCHLEKEELKKLMAYVTAGAIAFDTDPTVTLEVGITLLALNDERACQRLKEPMSATAQKNPAARFVYDSAALLRSLKD